MGTACLASPTRPVKGPLTDTADGRSPITLEQASDPGRLPRTAPGEKPPPLSRRDWRSNEEDPELLRRIRVAPPVATIETTRKRYELDVSKVDGRELRSAKRVLRKMDFDGRFVLDFGGGVTLLFTPATPPD